MAKTSYFHDYLRGAVSFTTGTHAIKVGGNLWHGGLTTVADAQGYGPIILRLLSGAPNGVVYRVEPQSAEERFLKGALFAQAPTIAAYLSNSSSAAPRCRRTSAARCSRYSHR